MSSMIKTTMLLAALTGLIMLIGGVLGGRGGLEIAFVFAIAMNFFSYWFSDKMVLKAYGAQPLDASNAPELYAIVNELANSANIPMPRLYLIDSDTPNACTQVGSLKISRYFSNVGFRGNRVSPDMMSVLVCRLILMSQ